MGGRGPREGGPRDLLDGSGGAEKITRGFREPFGWFRTDGRGPPEEVRGPFRVGQGGAARGPPERGNLGKRGPF